MGQVQNMSFARYYKSIYRKYLDSFFLFIVDIVTDVPIPPSLPAFTHPPPPFPSGHHHTVLGVHELIDAYMFFGKFLKKLLPRQERFF